MLGLSDNAKVGTLLVSLGFLFLFLGVLLVFDAGLMAIGACRASPLGLPLRREPTEGAARQPRGRCPPSGSSCWRSVARAAGIAWVHCAVHSGAAGLRGGGVGAVLLAALAALLATWARHELRRRGPRALCAMVPFCDEALSWAL